ncbi:MAG: KUP/HAK/KT family potassium transporter [Chitinophagaceae bacterium]|nr:KUP/HAK/KT family potassium transporter [Chitinophagaceae bacterium]
MSNHSNSINKVSAAGLLVALGIIYGDIGTSPLYVFNAITAGKTISRELILGSLSCIIWTLTMLTTIKYVLLVLKADNNGEGGVFALYALVRRSKKWLVIPAMIGGAALLADGILTPAITITSAIEGLRELKPLHDFQQNSIIVIVLIILTLLFFMQQFGTMSIGKLFGPIMIIWFLMLAILGLSNIGSDFTILYALNPYYAINFLINYPGALWLLGAVFLCTTGAEALYSDLGHCGKANIRYSWIFVKTCLLINYFGQGANLLSHFDGKTFTPEFIKANAINSFFDLMPGWFIFPGVIIATLAAIIASQALISGSFTLINEAIRLNLWPKMKVNFPTELKGQIFIPALNFLLYVGCVFIVLYFQSSSKMEAAYGFSIIIAVISTTILYANYLVTRRQKSGFIYLFIIVYLIIEIGFLVANIEKLPHGGFVAVILGGIIFSIMYIWFRSRKIKNRYVEFVKLKDYMHVLQELSNDAGIPKYATHLVYLTSANNYKEIEDKIIYSITKKKPKRADIYWFIHVDIVDDPYTSEYVVNTIVPNEIIRIDFRLGFRVEQRINLMFREVVKDMVENKEVNIDSRYKSLSKNKIPGDWQFIVMEKFLSHDNDLPLSERIMMKFYFLLKKLSLSEEKGFGLDTAYVTVEKFPLVVAPFSNLNLIRKEK